MTQPQREALLDLLIFSIFADSHLSLKEDEALHAAFDALGWEARKPREIFICNSMSRARKASSSDAASSEYIRSRAAIFTDTPSQNTAVELLQSVLSADETAASEDAFIARVKASFS